jgi:uncharacterized membrane protein YidH (DUF202 family)
MSKYFNKDVVNALLLTIFIVGIGLVAFGVYRYIDTTSQLNDNLAQQIRKNGGEINPESAAQAQGLMASDIARRGLVDDRFQGMIVGGVGIALLAFGWMATDVVRERRKKRNNQPTPESSPSSASA